MTKISSFDRNSLRVINVALERHLKAFADELGIDIKIGRTKFSAQNATVSVELATKAADGTVRSREAEAFSMLGPMYGFKPEDLGARFDIGSRTYTLLGFIPKSRKFPILARNVGDGREYTLPLDVVRAALGRSPREATRLTVAR